jgi:hypothetical protein
MDATPPQFCESFGCHATYLVGVCSALEHKGVTLLCAKFHAMKVPSPNPASPHVLIVEDEEKTRASVLEGFRLEGWDVRTAANGESALRC